MDTALDTSALDTIISVRTYLRTSDLRTLMGTLVLRVRPKLDQPIVRNFELGKHGFDVTKHSSLPDRYYRILIEIGIEAIWLDRLVTELHAVDQHWLDNLVLHPVFRLLAKIRVEQFATDGAPLISVFDPAHHDARRWALHCQGASTKAIRNILGIAQRLSQRPYHLTIAALVTPHC